MSDPFELSGAVALLTDDDVERLLDGELVPSLAPMGYGELAMLVGVAQSPPLAAELSGEASTVAMMSAIVRASAPTTRPVSSLATARRHRPLAKVLLAKVAAVVVVGGVAVTSAAAADLLPPPVQDAIAAAADHVGVTLARSSDQPGEPPATAPASTDGAGPDAPASAGDTTPAAAVDPAAPGDQTPGSPAAEGSDAPAPVDDARGPAPDSGGVIPGNAYGNGGVPGNGTGIGNANGLDVTTPHGKTR